MGVTSFPSSSTIDLSGGDDSRAFSSALADLADRWRRGEPAAAESYLHHGAGWSADRAVELIYREYRLAKSAGLAPSKSEYLARFPEHRRELQRLLDVDDACPDSLLERFDATDLSDDPLPRAGDAIGPYVLERELGRGGFARVFLARQADLEDRPVVVKITTRPTREPWLLARARHPHIVEILTHAEVDDGELQLIAMPFLGGAALSTLLEHRRSQPAEGRRESSRRFLTDLDAVSAPEHRRAGSASPSRALLRGMSDAEAFAWTAARLAEALDHAHRQGVAHGDVKPSNILIAADGTPMLLDFNLAQDWSRDDALDAGGTAAYMAPERLRALAGIAEPSPSRVDDEQAHRADVYSLGMVLLEALTGWSPAREMDADRRLGRSAFAAAAEARSRSDRLVRAAEAQAARPLPAGLRSILVHCLEADPRERHTRGLELAEDLDRWRTDRPLAFAPEPSGLHASLRWARRRRRPLAAAAAALGVAALALGIAARADRTAEARLGGHAYEKYTEFVDDPASPVLPTQRPDETYLRRRNPNETVTNALRILREYSIPTDPDWRSRDDFRLLAEDDREDLELLLLEHALRYGRVLAQRPDSPKDWRRAREILDHACGTTWPRELTTLRDKLTRQLGDAGSAAAALPGPTELPPAWVDAYLRGIAAEIGDGDQGPGTDSGARRAADFYAELLRSRPNSFWGHHRAAVVASVVDRWADAADHVEACLRRRPDNAVLRCLLATCLMNFDRDDEAVAQADQAIEAAPDRAEFVQVRAFARTAGSDLDALKRDLARYETLLGAVPSRLHQEAGVGDNLPLAPKPRRRAVDKEEADGVPNGEIKSRSVLAAWIREYGQPKGGDSRIKEVEHDSERVELAAREVEKILELDPTNLQAHIDSLCLDVFRRRYPEAVAEAEWIMHDPRLPEFARTSRDGLVSLQYSSVLLANAKEIRSALRLAAKTVELSIAVQSHHQGRAFYYLSLVEARAAFYNRKWFPRAAEHLDQAVQANPLFEDWFQQDQLFDTTRIQIQALRDARSRGVRARIFSPFVSL
ncbi:protein kinase domain-containing protein [Paludisphaera rhizosphaerae]|uniref:protein kinase domain-containing protein n=1 Tax=Paludisphaera rhizosphaerae TaxID=2711216 RepID=UPI0013E9DB0E|nr:protein kinase [Paludisphaera rhizosphaerae]